MKSARRIARKVGNDDEDGEEPQRAESNSASSVVKRPVGTTKGRSKSKLTPSVRTSFNANEFDDPSETAEESLESAVLQRNAARRIDASKNLPLRATSTLESRPGYSAEHLSELKTSTPNATKISTEGESSHQALDIASKFGDSALALSQTEQSAAYHIPSEAEIREKKERRRRLAKEQDFISLDDTEDVDDAESAEDSESGDYRTKSLIIHAEDDFKEQSKYGETRLVHEDEDIAEGFDDFVEDSGKVALGQKAAKQQERERRQAIEEQIRNAQQNAKSSGDNESEEDPEEQARNAAYEAAQTKAGTYGMTSSRRKEKDKEERLRSKLEMPKIQPVPDFKTVVARFTDMVTAKEHEINVNRKRLEKLEKEKNEIEEDEVRVKELLREAGERYENLRGETKVITSTEANGHPETHELNVPSDTSMRTASDSGDLEPNNEATPTESAFDQTFGAFRQAPSGMAQLANEEDDWY